MKIDSAADRMLRRAVAVVGFTLVACGSPIRVETTQVALAPGGPSMPETAILSEESVQLLRLYDLESGLQSDPVGVLEALDRMPGQMAKMALAAQAVLAKRRSGI